VNDGMTPAVAEMPFVSLILTTRDRPSFFPVALACYRHQTYVNRELIVVDSGGRFPVDPEAVAAAGGRLIRTEPGTPIGTKLNVGMTDSNGYIGFVIDDDDWYGPGYVATMVARLLADWRDASLASMAGAQPYLIFDLARWQIRRTVDSHTGGGTLCFRREDWAAHPFRPISLAVDHHFLRDQAELGTRLLTVAAPEDFLGVRHGGAGDNRGHTWTNAEGYLRRLPPHTRGPDAVLPDWALAFYRGLHAELYPQTESRRSQT
jgi:glycosyltransferase involved in cell wall biosynthesis